MQAALAGLLVLGQAGLCSAQAEAWQVNAVVITDGVEQWSISAVTTDRDRLTLTCVPATQDISVGLQPGIGFMYEDDDVLVRYKADDHRSVRADFRRTATNGTVLRGEPAMKMMQTLAAAQRRFTYQDELVLARFSVEGKQQALLHLAAKCPHLTLKPE